MNKPFKFKQFTIHQHQTAMKVGTDGVLLGSWTSLNHSHNSILDIGAGTGLLALMLAQRSAAETIDSLEIDGNAYEQSVENFETSPWSDRLFCYHAGLDEFVKEWSTDETGMDERYDLIVSNPPYFRPSPPLPGASPSESGKNGVESRKRARFYDALPFEELLTGVSKLLSKEGIFATIIPYWEEEFFVKLAAVSELFPRRITRVRGNPTAEIKRSLLEFGFSSEKIRIDELIIEMERHQYTQDYIALTKDFYLKMQQ